MSDLPPAQPTESSLLDTELRPGHDFHKTLKAIFSIPKADLDEQMKAEPQPPQKRGRKAKAKQ